MDNDILEAEKDRAEAVGMLKASVIVLVVGLIAFVVSMVNPVTIEVNCSVDTVKQTTVCERK